MARLGGRPFAEFQIVWDYEVQRFNRSGRRDAIPPEAVIPLANHPGQPAPRREQHSECSSKERGRLRAHHFIFSLGDDPETP